MRLGWWLQAHVSSLLICTGKWGSVCSNFKFKWGILKYTLPKHVQESCVVGKNE